MLYLPDGSPLTDSSFLLEWSTQRPSGSHWDDFRHLGRLDRYANQFVRVVHEVVHFTYPDPDACDDYGRDRFTTLHRFAVPDTDLTTGQDLGECPQFTSYRDYPPPVKLWPAAVAAFTQKLQRVYHAQVFVEKYLCDDDQYDMTYRYPLQSRTRRE